MVMSFQDLFEERFVLNKNGEMVKQSMHIPKEAPGWPEGSVL